ncbi:MAG: molybdopterin cofactor-binding domain-containing protein, partial [Myxococcota bacterium]
MSGITRRQFIATGLLAGGGLALGTALFHKKDLSDVRDLAVSGDEILLNTWVKLAPDGKATVYVPHAEMGQGILTSLPMMLADEMDLAWSQVEVVQAPAKMPFVNRGLLRGYIFGDWNVPEPLSPVIDLASLKVAELMAMQLTGGSTSVRFTGQFGMRRAGAAARSVLVQAAAEEWGVEAETLETREGVIYHAASDRSAPYADFAARAAELDLPKQPTLKTPDQLNLVGTNVPRVDLPDKVNGRAAYGIDAELPNMRYAAIAPVPAFGGTVTRFDATDALALPGVEQVFEIEGAVAVVADKYWRAKKGLAALKVEFGPGTRGPVTTASLLAEQDAALAGDELEIDVEVGDTDAAWSEAAELIEGSYSVPYLAHATMEPMNATAWMHDGECEVWTGAQNNLGAAKTISDTCGLPMEKITVHPMLLGGGFGRRGSSTMDYASQAVQIAMQVPHPVKLIWTREDDLRHDAYRPAQRSNLRGALDGEGRPLAWQHDFVGKHEPVEATIPPYAIPNQRVRYAEDKAPVPFGPWRSVDHSQHAFFIESFIDELAIKAGADPLAYRLDLLKDSPRHRKVLELAAERAGWNEPIGPGRGRGIALCESFGSVVAEVVEVTVTNGDVEVDRVIVAADTGEVIHPDALEAQLESGVIYGLTAALYGEIT